MATVIAIALARGQGPSALSVSQDNSKVPRRFFLDFFLLKIVVEDIGPVAGGETKLLMDSFDITHAKSCACLAQGPCLLSRSDSSNLRICVYLSVQKS